ncbi:MAG: DUF1385 domain-containing protein [Candidatus Eisenbacteria bacterium]|nr:DUF1385 domain-containing protein [Candidatus Eisenbacteria bacterium]
MMRSPGRVATAVRRQDGAIVWQEKPFISVTRKVKPLGWPVVRGAVVLIEAMSLGISSLSYAADEAAREPGEAAPAPGEKKTSWFSALVLPLTVAASLVLGFLAFFALPLWLTGLFHLRSSLGFNLVDGVFRLAIFLLYLWGIGRWSEMQRVFEYHGAEHKTIHALEAGVELTPENVQQFSRFHPRCGTSFLLIVMLLSIVVFSLLGKPENWLQRVERFLFIPVIAGVGFEFVRLSAKYSSLRPVAWLIQPGLDLQKLTTREPSMDQLEVAITALKAVWNEETAAMAPDAALAAACEG